ncbi:TPA: AraC family transcriptional regulator N-terminal domain-containing protein [Enterobacter hormaechei]|uniref:AraC family transcriptional regulator n=1 Tax=Escherichia coli TaxID=562 RepID=UPI0005CB4C75|nr:AraC family transcriptional regulator [Escherichia coli]KPO36082.1 AraC family transcriptional regulator [Escherichia coli]STF99674.1 DNA-binding transcriptional regulator [Escherichia coli]HAH9124868.1 AraC family transcriptional regulator [Escherichia coli]HCD1361791.1 AraC family transcriptional regulator [Klebsiella pneumoniae subsp. pneumoniae]
MRQVQLSVTDELRTLCSLISYNTPYDGTFDLPIPGVHLTRSSKAYRSLIHGVTQPCVCLVAQGAKAIHVGTDIYQYDEARMLVYSVDVPVAAQVVRASHSSPFLGIRIDIDEQRITELAMRVFPQGLKNTVESGAIHVVNSDTEIISAASRLLRVMMNSESIHLLGPVIIDEILIRLLLSPLGRKIAQIGHTQSPLRRISKAVIWLREHFAENFTINDLAASVHMSSSTFYQHFKSVTSLSPLQYQKALRLLEARRLLLSTARDVDSVGRAVGYLSSSQFSREYTRMFGDAPSRDTARLLKQAVLNQSSF